MSSSARSLFTPSFKNIVFATDFSQCSQRAIPYLRAIAQRYGSTIHVVHVLPPEPVLEIPLDAGPDEDADRDAVLAEMKAMLASKPFGGTALTTTVIRGMPWQVLASVVEEKQADLIVVGTHGRRGLAKIVLGSVSEQVFRHARCPVLTVGPHANEQGTTDANLGTILFATDFSAGSLRALPYAQSLARANHSHLVLLHVVSVSMDMASNYNVEPATLEVSADFIQASIASAHEQLAKLIPGESTAELSPEIIVDCGLAAETILEVAKNKQASLIVMGAHGASKSSLVTHLPWATSSEVVCRAHCPVLTVRS